MAPKPFKKWWRSSAKVSDVGHVYDWHTEKVELRTVWSLGELSPIGLLDQGMSEEIETEVGACPACGEWDKAGRKKPVDIILRDRTIRGKPLKKSTLRNLWVQYPRGSPVPIMRRELLEALGPERTAEWCLGSVQTADGAQLDDFVSYFDPLEARYSTKYTKDWFQHSGSNRFGACPGCGRFDFFVSGPTYLDAALFEKRSTIATHLGFMADRSTVGELELYAKARWPQTTMFRVPTHDVDLDPVGLPVPAFWSEVEEHQRAHGMTIQFPKVAVPDGQHPGDWLEAQINDRGWDACVTEPAGHNKPWPKEITKLTFFIRLRALWEPEIAHLVDPLSDAELGTEIKKRKSAHKERGFKGNWFDG